MLRTKILFLLSCFATILSAQTVHRLTLEEAVRLALKQNPDMSVSLLDEQIVKQQIAEVKGGVLPQVSGTGQYTDNFSLPQQILPGEVFGQPGTTIPVTFGVRYGVNAGVTVNQQLFNQKLITGIKSTEALKELYQLNTLKTKEDIVNNVAKLYIQIQVTEKQKAIVTSNYERSLSLLEITEVQYENGLIKELDVNQIKVNQANLFTEIENSEITKEEQLNYLKLYLNIPVQDKIELTENIVETQSYPLQDNLNVNANVQYRQFEQQQELSKLEEKAIKAEYYPTLNAFLNYSYQGQTNEFQFYGDGYNHFTTGSWGLTLNVPIFDGLQRQKRLEQAKLESEKLKQQKEQLELNISVTYQNAVRRLDLSKRQVENQKRNMELANNVYQTSSLSYKEGIISLSELLDAETSLQEAQSNYLSSLLSLKIAELEHLKASGLLATLIETEN